MTTHNDEHTFEHWVQWNNWTFGIRWLRMPKKGSGYRTITIELGPLGLCWETWRDARNV